MDLARILSFVLPLGCDTFAIAIALGLRGTAWLRPTLVFTVFEMAMPVVGIVAGRFVGERAAVAAHIAGGIVLLGVGMHAWREAFDDDDESAGLRFDTLRGAALAGAAISADELAVGFPLGTAGLPFAPLLLAIGLQAFVATAAGIALGRRFGTTRGRRTARVAGIAAAVAFFALGVALLAQALR